MYISLIAHVNLCTSAQFSQALLQPLSCSYAVSLSLSLFSVLYLMHTPALNLLGNSQTIKACMILDTATSLLKQRHRKTPLSPHIYTECLANQQKVTETNHVGSQLDSLLMLLDLSGNNGCIAETQDRVQLIQSWR